MNNPNTNVFIIILNILKKHYFKIRRMESVLKFRCDVLFLFFIAHCFFCSLGFFSLRGFRLSESYSVRITLNKTTYSGKNKCLR